MPHPLARFHAEAMNRLNAALADLAPGTTPDFQWDGTPPMGDLAAGCFPLAKTMKRAPADIAAGLAEAVRKGLQKGGSIGDVTAAGPYVNFYLEPQHLVATLLDETHRKSTAFGVLPARSERVILEHTSANPNGPLHVGRARNPIIGDTLVRIYRAAGFETRAQYYIDDMGKQVAILTYGLENLDKAQVTALLGPPRTDKIDHDLVRYYQAANQLMEEDPAVAEKIQELIRATEEGDKDALARVDAGYKEVFGGMLESLARLDVTFDDFVKESTFVVNGDTERVIDRLRSQAELPVGEEGKALYLELEGKGVTGRSTKFFFRRSDGTSLYPTRDVAYHMWKAGEADLLVNVLGEDHRLQAKQVRVCLELLHAPRVPDVVFYAFVSLPEGKMSTRRNRVVFIDDLLDEAVARAYEEVKRRRGEDLAEEEMRGIAEVVGVGAVRFAIIKVQPEKPITFKWEEALAFDGFASPFVQYSHARLSSILRKAQDMGLQPDTQGAPLLVHDSEVKLAKTIARLPVIVSQAAEKHRPHLVAQYSFDVAAAFNDFYRDCRVLDAATEDLVRARLAMVEAARVAIAKSLGLLGIVAPMQM